MSPLLYALNIGTLAIWLGVVGLGVVNRVIFIWHPEPKSAREGESVVVLPKLEIALGEAGPDGGGGDPVPEPPAPLPAEADEIPAPPAMPEVAAMAPLPEIPELPETPAKRPEKTVKPTGPTRTTARPSTSGGRPAAVGSPGSTQGGGGGISASARLAAGRMPAPEYPPEARRLGQTGKVMVAFTVGTDGSVIAATADRPSPWPLLNNEAVRTVRRWKFPPGAVIKLRREIVFQLN